MIRLWYHRLRPWLWHVLSPVVRLRYASVLRWTIYDAECKCEIGLFATPQEANAYLDCLGGGQYWIWPTFDHMEMVSHTPNPDFSLTFKRRKVE